MENIILNVEGMSCEHCIKSITTTLLQLDGVTNVEISLENKTVSVSHNGSIKKEVLKSEIEDIGYDVV